jgi:hypothetical protein
MVPLNIESGIESCIPILEDGVSKKDSIENLEPL